MSVKGVDPYMCMWSFGCMHMHVVCADNIDALDSCICAYVSVNFNDDTQECIMPTDALQKHVVKNALYRQQHYCTYPDGRPRLCLPQKSNCKLHFPNSIHRSFSPTFHQQARRYQYACFRTAHQYTVAYLVELLLLMDARVNIARGIREAWSAYHMNYATKQGILATLNLSDADIISLGFKDKTFTIWLLLLNTCNPSFICLLSSSLFSLPLILLLYECHDLFNLLMFLLQADDM
jgi:hypothetical protein